MDSGGRSTADGIQIQPPGTLVSLLTQVLRGPVRVSRAACAFPGRLLEGLSESLRAAVRHIKNRSRDYVFLYELLSLGCPLLCMMHEVLQQIYRDA